MSVSDETTTVTDGIVLTDAAASKVKALLDQEGRDDLALRVAVQPGGCSGLRYQLFFDERSLDGDVVKDFGGVKVVTDRMSAPYLGGATIDFVDTIEKQGFTIDNPNATGSCACGAPSAEHRRSARRTAGRRRRPRDHGTAAFVVRQCAAQRAAGGAGRRAPPLCSGTGSPSAVTTWRSPSGASSRSVCSYCLAIRMHTLSGQGVSVTRTVTFPPLSLAVAS